MGTMTELRMSIEAEEREKILKWVSKLEFVGQEIEVTVSGWNHGPIGKLKCEVKEWIPANSNASASEASTQ